MATKRSKGSRALTSIQNRRPALTCTVRPQRILKDPLGVELVPSTLCVSDIVFSLENESMLASRLKAIKGYDVWVDTCFVASNFNQLVKDTLMCQNRIMIAGGIERELSIAYSNPLKDAAFSSSSLTTAGKGILWESFDHYFSILKYRKVYGEQIASRFLLANGRYPTRAEFSGLIDRGIASDGEVIAWDGHDRRDSPNRFHDEELVTLAFLNALHTKRHTIILTSDEGVISQFVALSQKIQSDWIAMLLAQHISRNLSEFKRYQLKDENEDFESPQFIYEMHPIAIMNLEPLVNQIVVGCWKITNNGDGGYYMTTAYKPVSSLSYSILSMKKDSGGRSTDLFGDMDAACLFAESSTTKTGILLTARPKIDIQMNMSRFDQSTILKGFEKKVEVTLAPRSTSKIWTPSDR